MDQGYTVDVVFLDFVEAFDCGNHSFPLWAKIKSIGLGDIVATLPFVDDVKLVA